MGLEQRDPRTGKYVLFDTVERHNTACSRYPFEQIPGRVFLDTNIINLIVKHGGSIFEGEPLPDGIDGTAAHDIEALMHIFYVGSRAHWNILGSPKTLEELLKT
jgi:hypothetical protein